MPDNKLPDKEIVKALECCIESNSCSKCPFANIADIRNCTSELSKNTLDLINRLQAQNEVYETCNARKDEAIKSLESRLKKLQMQFDDISKMYNEIKAEAYKECIEKVWELAVCMHPCSDELKILGSDLDNLLKELVGEDK